MDIYTSLRKSYSDKHYRHTTIVRHKGTVIAFAMDGAGRIDYTMLDLNAADADKGTLDVNYWTDNPAELLFPQEITQAGYGIIDPFLMPAVAKAKESGEVVDAGSVRQDEIDVFLSSTARFTADAPFQALSDEQYVYVFRQSITTHHPNMVFQQYEDGTYVKDAAGNKVPLVNGTLLVDRFILSGSTLMPKMEVRYRRSRNKYRAQSNKDSLGAIDMEKRPFYEPTQELDFVRNLQQGRFSVLLLPTQIANVKRWQIFAHNSRTAQIDSFNIERADDGLFNTKGTQLYTSPDADYRHAVLEREPGSCPFTGLDLVPIISTSGYAGTALKFNGQNVYVELPAASTFGLANSDFTVEAWVKASDFAGGADKSILGMDHPGGDPKNRTLHLIIRNQKPYLGFSYNDLGGQTVLDPDVWYHLAWRYTAATQEQAIFVNGALDASEPNHEAFQGTGKLILGRWNNGNYFSGDIDEVRIWNHARSANEIREDMHRRLIGNETGLHAYWRCDEGAGNRLYDQTDNANHATIFGDAAWADSDAPIGNHPGIRRSSLGFAGRSVASGLSSILYYQQENAASGYDQQVKPVKRNVRVMLAASTAGPDSAGTPTNKCYISALDLAVSREGTITQTPDVLTLPFLSSEFSGDNLNLTLEKIVVLEGKVSELKARIADLNGDIGGTDTDILALENSVREILEIERQAGQLAMQLEKYKRPRYATFYDNSWSPFSTGGNSFRMKIGESRDVDPVWNDIISYIRWEPGVRIEAYEHYNYGGQKWIWPTFPFQTWTGLFDTLWNNKISSIKVTADKDLSDKIADAENQLQQKRNRLEELEPIKLALVEARAKLTLLQTQLQLAGAELQVKTTTLADLKKALQGEVPPLPMPLLHVDRHGLSVSGGVLEFAYTEDAPQFFDSATGKLALYFRGNKDQFFAAYYDTATAKASQTLAATQGQVSFIARAAEPEMDKNVITVEGENAARCTVTISNPATHFIETWTNVLRDAAEFAAILNGEMTKPVFLGRLATETLDTNILTLSTRIKQAIPAGATVMILGVKAIVAAEVAATATEIPLQAPAPVYNADTEVFLIPYDYAQATTDTPGYNLQNGSLHVYVSVGNAKGAVQNGSAISSGTTPSCRWVAEAPGSALEFDGLKNSLVQTDAQKIPRFDADGDLTLEAWVRPAEVNDLTPRVIYHKSNSSQYVLGLQKATLQSALKFDGLNNYVAIDKLHYTTQIQGITVEAWVKTSKTSQAIIASWDRSEYWRLAIGSDVAKAQQRVFWATVDESGQIDDMVGNTSVADGLWHFVSVTYEANGGSKRIYVDGMLDAEIIAHDGRELGTGTKRYGFIGVGSEANEYNGIRSPLDYFEGELDEMRIWDHARTESEINADMKRRLSGSEPGLTGYWHFEGGVAKDYSLNGHDGVIKGNTNVTVTTSPLDAFTLFAGVGDQFAETRAAICCNNWEHLALAYNQSYALQFDGNNDVLTCEHNTVLDINRDMSIEVYLTAANRNQSQGVLSKGQLHDGTDQHVPYALYLDSSGKIAFAFEDKNGNKNVYRSSAAIKAGKFYKIAVTRKYESEIKNEGTENDPNITVKEWTDIRFYLNGQFAGEHIYSGADAGSNNQPLYIGQAYGLLDADDVSGSNQSYLAGTLSEVRIWNTALQVANLGSRLNGQEKGLISWWRFEENDSNIAYDSKSSNHALRQGATWVKNPDPNGSKCVMYRNGIAQEISVMDPQTFGTMDIPPDAGSQGFALGAAVDELNYQGRLEEVRIWKTARSQEQIQDNLFTRLKGERRDLIANYSFDRESSNRISDDSLQGNHLELGSGENKPEFVLSTAPISDDIALVRSALAGVKTQFNDTINGRPVIAEYGDLQADSDGNLKGVMKRCYAYIKHGQWHLMTGYKVGNLVTEWIGQVQADPQLIGYIEGAPPVPGENLTATGLVLGEVEDYRGASAVELKEADEVNYLYSSSRETGIDSSTEFKLGFGFGAEIEGGLGLSIRLAEQHLVFGVHGKFEHSESTLNESSVSYGRNDTKASRLELHGNWEQATPLENGKTAQRRFVPENAGYALVQSDTMDVFALRLEHNNALVAYRFMPNPDIPKDWNIINFPLNAAYTKQGTLDGKLGCWIAEGSNGEPTYPLRCDAEYPNAATYGEYSFYKPKEAYALKKKIERQHQALETYYRQIYSTITNAKTDTQQKNIPTDLTRHNLADTYVWTAAGGFFTESSDVMETVQESTTGSYSFVGMGGIFAEAEFFVKGMVVEFELDALFGGHIDTEKSRDKETEHAISLEVEAAPENDLQLYVTGDAERAQYQGRVNEGGGAYDEAGHPIKRPGKVDAYRFMTFYLEPDKNHAEDFFNKVIDPIWLQESDEPNAVALRQARQDEKKPACWRILHRVTYVSRVLPPFSEDAPAGIEKAMQAENIASNWELIKKLEPFVKDKTHNRSVFEDAVRKTVDSTLPELKPYIKDILIYAILYFDVSET